MIEILPRRYLLALGILELIIVIAAFTLSLFGLDAWVLPALGIGNFVIIALYAVTAKKLSRQRIHNRIRREAQKFIFERNVLLAESQMQLKRLEQNLPKTYRDSNKLDWLDDPVGILLTDEARDSLLKYREMRAKIMAIEGKLEDLADSWHDLLGNSTRRLTTDQIGTELLTIRQNAQGHS